MWTKRFDNFAKVAWVGLLAFGVALYAYNSRRARTLDSPPRFRGLTQEETVKARSGGQVIGDPSVDEADIVVFSRYTCSFSQELLLRLESMEGEDDRRPTLRIRHLVHPMDSASYRAALGMVCADSYGRAREFHSALLQDTSQKRVTDLISIAAGMGIDDLRGFGVCLGSDGAATSVLADFEHGMELGITGVPALIAGDRLMIGGLRDAEIRELFR